MAGEACFVDPTPYQVRVGCVRMCVLRARIHSARASSAAFFDRSLRQPAPRRGQWPVELYERVGF